MATTRVGTRPGGSGPDPRFVKGQRDPGTQFIAVPDGQAPVAHPNGISPITNAPVIPGSLSALLGPLTELANGDPAVLKALLAGRSAAEVFFSPGSLGRVRDEIAPQEIKFHNQLEQQAAQAGGRTAQGKEALDLLRAQVKFQGSGAGGISPELQNILKQRQQEVDFARQTDPNLAFALEKRRAGLEGLNAQENQALREQGTSALNRGFQSALRGVAQGRAGSGISGPASGLAFAPATGQFLDAQRGLERDVLLANVDEKNRRLAGFEGLAGDIQARRFGQTQQAIGGLESLRTSAETNQFNRSQQSRQAFDDALFRREQAELGDRNSSFDRFVNFQRDLDLRLLDRQRINLNLLEKEKAGQAGTIFGFGGFGAAQAGRKTAEEIAREQIQAGLETARIQADAMKESAALGAAAFGGGGGGSVQFTNDGQPLWTDTNGDGNSDTTNRSKQALAPVAASEPFSINTRANDRDFKSTFGGGF